MSTIGSLAVNVAADTGSFTTKIRGARHELGTFGKVGESVTHQIKHLFGALAAGFAIHAIVEKVHAAGEALVELGHAAERLDVSTESLGGLEHASRLAHISNEELIKDFTFMEKNVGKNADAFRTLGLHVGDLRQMKADQMFLTIAEAIERMPTAAQKTAATLAIFGKGGAGMMKLIGQGPEAIRAQMEEAKRMGLAPSDADIKKIQEADRAFIEAMEKFRALWQGIAIQVAKLISLLGGEGAAKLKSTAGQLVDKMDPEKIKHFQKTLETWNAMSEGEQLAQYTKDPMKEYHSLIGDKEYAWQAKEGVLQTAYKAFVEAVQAKGDRENDRFAQSFERMQAAQDARVKQMHAPRELLESAKTELPKLWSGIKTAWEAENNPLFPKNLIGGVEPASIGDGKRMGALDVPGSEVGRILNAHPKISGGLTESEMKRISLLADQMDHPFWDTRNQQKEKTSGGRLTGGFSTIEEGSVEAFRQDRRSTLAATNIAAMSLEEEKKQTKALGHIDKAIEKTAKQEIVMNFA
jgi:hypothetical protein